MAPKGVVAQASPKSLQDPTAAYAMHHSRGPGRFKLTQLSLMEGSENTLVEEESPESYLGYRGILGLISAGHTRHVRHQKLRLGPDMKKSPP
jgi:hypothetical protein